MVCCKFYQGCKGWWKGCGTFQIQRSTMESVGWQYVPHLDQYRAKEAMLICAISTSTFWIQLAVHKILYSCLIWEHKQSWLYEYVVVFSNKLCPIWNATGLHGMLCNHLNLLLKRVDGKMEKCLCYNSSEKSRVQYCNIWNNQNCIRK